MSTSDFVASTYAPRAQDYVTSAVHAAGADLDQMEAALAGLRLGRVLDLGCGGGHVSYRAAAHAGEVVACDPTEAMLKAVAAEAAARGLSNIRTQQASAERLPFPDGYFDAVLSRFTAHHWQDFEAGLREARRVTRAGGLAVFIDTVAPRDPMLDSHLQAMELLRDPSHGRNYTVGEWLAGLGRAGFAVSTVTERKLRMEFPVWIARTKVPAGQAAAIRAMQEAAPEAMRRHFDVGPDGSFDLDVVTFVGAAG